MTNFHDPFKKRENSYALDSESVAEMTRLLNQDRFITKNMGGIFPQRCDPSRITHVLDVACGPGGWAIELASTHRDIEVTGVDISRTMIGYANTQANIQKLDNIHFVVQSIVEPLPFEDNSFDFVNGRFLASFMYRWSWPQLLKELFRITSPEGIIRLTEFDEVGTTNAPAYTKLQRIVGQASLLNGQSFSPDGQHLGITPMLGRFLADVGCKPIYEQVYALDFSAGAEAHLSCYENCKIGWKLIQPYMLTTGMTTQEELDSLYNRMLAEMMSDDFRAIWYYLSSYGIKPG